MVQSMLQALEFTPTFHPAETEKLSRTGARNVSQKCKSRKEITKKQHHASQRITTQVCQANTRFMYYMKSHIKEIWVLRKLLLNWCILCEHFVLTRVKHDELCLSSLILRIVTLSPFWLMQTPIASTGISPRYLQIGIRCGSKTIISIQKVAQNQSSDLQCHLQCRKWQRKREHTLVSRHIRSIQLNLTCGKTLKIPQTRWKCSTEN